MKENIAKREQGDEQGSGFRTKTGAEGIDGQKAEARRFDRAMHEAGKGGDIFNRATAAVKLIEDAMQTLRQAVGRFKIG